MIICHEIEPYTALVRIASMDAATTWAGLRRVNGDGLTAAMALVPLFCDAVEFIRTSKEGADSLAFLRSRPSTTAAFRRASLDRFAIPNFYADKSLTRRLLVQFRGYVTPF